jgi:hypothetical protein
MGLPTGLGHFVQHLLKFLSHLKLYQLSQQPASLICVCVHHAWSCFHDEQLLLLLHLGVMPTDGWDVYLLVMHNALLLLLLLCLHRQRTGDAGCRICLLYLLILQRPF